MKEKDSTGFSRITTDHIAASKRRPAVGEDALEEGWEELQDEEVEEAKDNLPEDLILHDLNKPQ